MELNWIYCEDELPTMGERVLFCVDGFVGEGYINGEGVWFRNMDYPLHLVFDAEVKKWMPMPKG